ncbi:MAG: lysine biosynthesis protein LysX [Candidatus Bathyarchaeia archaeon]
MSKTIGMIYDQIRPEERLLIDSARRKSLRLNLHDAERINLDLLDHGKEEPFEDVILQRCISYFRSLHLTASLEKRGITVINSSRIASICGNKLLTTLELAEAKIPIPRARLAFSVESALDALSKLGYPAVLKPIIGSWGRLVAPLKDVESAKAIFEDREHMFPLYQVYYIQEMIQRPPRDIRCFIIGDAVVAAIYRYAPKDDWRTNTARGGHVEPCKVTPEIEELALKTVKALGEGVYGVDMMESDRGLLINEVNFTTEFRNSVPATGVDIPGKILDFAASKVRK